MNIDTEKTPDEAEEKAKLNLDVQVKETSACERHVTVTIPRDDIEQYFTKQFDDLLPKAEVPGFRAGRAPRALVENKFRKQVADQVKGSLLMDSLSQISDEQEFAAISEPDLDFETIQLPDDGPLTYEFNIEVRPEFDIPEWRGLKLRRPEHEFSEEEIDRNVGEFLGQLSDLVPVDEPAKTGDYVVINIKARHNGEVVSELDEQTVPLRPKLTFSIARSTISRRCLLVPSRATRKRPPSPLASFQKTNRCKANRLKSSLNCSMSTAG